MLNVSGTRKMFSLRLKKSCFIFIFSRFTGLEPEMFFFTIFPQSDGFISPRRLTA